MTRDLRSAVEKAQGAWRPLPDWVEELAGLVDRAGLKGAARRVGYSASAISNVVNGRYPGDIGRVEERVRGALMDLTVECPRLGEIGRDACLDWQKKPFAATSSLRVQMYRACRSGCPHSRVGGGDGRA